MKTDFTLSARLFGCLFVTDKLQSLEPLREEVQGLLNATVRDPFLFVYHLCLFYQPEISFNRSLRPLDMYTEFGTRRRRGWAANLYEETDNASNVMDKTGLSRVSEAVSSATATAQPTSNIQSPGAVIDQQPAPPKHLYSLEAVKETEAPVPPVILEPPQVDTALILVSFCGISLIIHFLLLQVDCTGTSCDLFLGLGLASWFCFIVYSILEILCDD